MAEQQHASRYKATRLTSDMLYGLMDKLDGLHKRFDQLSTGIIYRKVLIEDPPLHGKVDASGSTAVHMLLSHSGVLIY
jgi:hypothetical protein